MFRFWQFPIFGRSLYFDHSQFLFLQFLGNSNVHCDKLFVQLQDADSVSTLPRIDQDISGSSRTSQNHNSQQTNYQNIPQSQFSKEKPKFTFQSSQFCNNKPELTNGRAEPEGTNSGCSQKKPDHSRFTFKESRISFNPKQTRLSIRRMNNKTNSVYF